MTFYVFRRTDAEGNHPQVGTLNCSDERQLSRRLAAHPRHRFEILLVTGSWPEAEQAQRAHREILPLTIDVFDPPDRGFVGDHTGQMVAQWQSDATCVYCLDAWRVAVSPAGRNEPLDARPITGAFLVEIDHNLEPICRRHIEVHDRLAICP